MPFRFAVLPILGALAMMCAVAIMIAQAIGVRTKLSKLDLVVLVWLLFDFEVRVSLTLSYLIVLQFLGGVKTSNSVLAFLWKEISVADKKWQDADPVVVAVQLSALLMTPLCILTILAIIRGSFYRHFFQLILSFSELYNVWMIWSTEWIRRGKNLYYPGNASLWICMFLIYSLWIIFPLVLMGDSWVHLQKEYIYRKRQLEWVAKFASIFTLNSKTRSRSTVYMSSVNAITNNDSATKQTRHELNVTLND